MIAWRRCGWSTARWRRTAAATSTSTGWPTAGLRCCTSGSPKPSRPGSPSPTRWCWPPSTDGQAGHPHACCARASTRPASPSTPTTTPPRARELAATPYASVTFPWYALGRQVHVRGAVTKVQPEETAEYWSQTAARLAAGGVGLGAVPADRLAGRAAGPAGRGDRAVRRRRAGSGAAALGWLPHRARGRRVLAGPGEPDAQPDSGDRAAGPATWIRSHSGLPCPSRWPRLAASHGCSLRYRVGPAKA